MPFLRLFILLLCLSPFLGPSARAEDDIEILEAELKGMPADEAKGGNQDIPTEITSSQDTAEIQALEQDLGQDDTVVASELNEVEQSTPSLDDTVADERDLYTPPPPPPKREYSSEEFRNMSRQEILNYHRDLIHGQNPKEEEETEAVAEPIFRKYSINFGGQALGDTDGQSVWPTLQFHGAQTKRYVIGLIGSLNEFKFTDLEVRSYSGTVTLTYYPQDTYNGVFGRVGLGFGRYYYRPSGSTDYIHETVSLNAMATLGWRWLFAGKTLNLGFEGGAMYYFLPSIDGNIFNRAGSVTASVVLPIFLIDFGFTF